MAVYGRSILESNIEITAEQINELCLFFNNTELTESYIEETVNNSFDVTGFFFKLGVQNPYLIQNCLKDSATQIANTIKNEGITESSRKHIATTIRECYDNVLDILKSTDTPIPDNSSYDKNKLKNGLVLVVADILINTLCNLILTLLLGPHIGRLATVIIVGPIVEELSKQLAIRGGFSVEYTFMFNFYEASSYVINMTMMKIPLKNAIRGRLLCVGMHLTNTIINALSLNKNVQKKLNIEKEEDKDKLALIGNLTGLLIHMTWNTLASFSQGFNNLILGLK